MTEEQRITIQLDAVKSQETFKGYEKKTITRTYRTHIECVSVEHHLKDYVIATNSYGHKIWIPKEKILTITYVKPKEASG